MYRPLLTLLITGCSADFFGVDDFWGKSLVILAGYGVAFAVAASVLSSPLRRRHI